MRGECEGCEGCEGAGCFTFRRLKVSKVVKGIPAHWSRQPTDKNHLKFNYTYTEWAYINYVIM